MEAFLEESVNFTHVYECSEPRSTTKNPPTPFTTSSLQQKASSELNISPKETMSLCQKLYEGGYITYMRTDSRVYSLEFLEKTSEYICDTYGGTYVHENIFQLSERNNDNVRLAIQHDAYIGISKSHPNGPDPSISVFCSRNRGIKFTSL